MERRLSVSTVVLTSPTMSKALEAPVFSHGIGSDIYALAGERLLDLVMGFGSAFLGHAHPLVTARLQEQAGRLWNCARQTTDVRLRVDALLAELLPQGLRVGGFASTGMEVAEFAMRVAATHTGRAHFAGFSHRNSFASEMAVVPLPTPIGPAKIIPCGSRSARYARRRVLMARDWPTKSRVPFRSSYSITSGSYPPPSGNSALTCDLRSERKLPPELFAILLGRMTYWRSSKPRT